MEKDEQARELRLLNFGFFLGYGEGLYRRKLDPGQVDNRICAGSLGRDFEMIGNGGHSDFRAD
jgi:hypothetical protein